MNIQEQKKKLIEFIEKGEIVKEKEFHPSQGGFPFSYISGPLYDEWMNEIFLFNERYLKNHPMHDLIAKVYELKDRDDSAYDKIVGYIKSILADKDFFVEKEDLKSPIRLKPQVFISYSWDDENHKQWVKSLSDKLNDTGISTILDQKNLVLGDPLPEFMEKSITESDYVLIICTPTYKKKADARRGGVGYEESIITNDVYLHQNQRKYITVLSSGTWETSTPTWAGGKYGADLSARPYDEEEFNKIIYAITGNKIEAERKRNKSITTGTTKIEKTLSTETKDDIKILGIIKEEITLPKNDGSKGSALYCIPFRLSRKPSNLWVEYFINYWNHPLSFSSMHRPGIAKVVYDKVLLDGTTVEEVQNYHKEVLEAAINHANAFEKKHLREVELAEQRKKAKEEKLREDILSKVDDIVF